MWCLCRLPTFTHVSAARSTKAGADPEDPGHGRHGSADHKPLIGREPQNSRTILNASESQTPQGVRGADGADVLLACNYTISGSLPQGMWWQGSLTTGRGSLVSYG